MAAIPIADLDNLTDALRRAGVLGDVSIRAVTLESDLQAILSRIFRLRRHLDGDSSAPMSWEADRDELAFYRDVVSTMPSGPLLRCIKAPVGLEPQMDTDDG
jgi:hypothetical protein